MADKQTSRPGGSGETKAAVPKADSPAKPATSKPAISTPKPKPVATVKPTVASKPAAKPAVTAKPAAATKPDAATKPAVAAKPGVTKPAVAKPAAAAAKPAPKPVSKPAVAKPAAAIPKPRAPVGRGSPATKPVASTPVGRGSPVTKPVASAPPKSGAEPPDPTTTENAPAAPEPEELPPPAEDPPPPPEPVWEEMKMDARLMQMKDVLNTVHKSGRPLCLIDESGEAAMWLRYKDANYHSMLYPQEIESERLRMSLLSTRTMTINGSSEARALPSHMCYWVEPLSSGVTPQQGAIRYGKQFVIDMGFVETWDALPLLLEPLVPDLFEHLMTGSLLQDECYMKLVRESDATSGQFGGTSAGVRGNQFDPEQFNCLGDFMFGIVTKLKNPPHDIAKRMYVVNLLPDDDSD